MSFELNSGTAASALDGTELVPISQGGVARKLVMSKLVYMAADGDYHVGADLVVGGTVTATALLGLSVLDISAGVTFNEISLGASSSFYIQTRVAAPHDTDIYSDQINFVNASGSGDILQIAKQTATVANLTFNSTTRRWIDFGTTGSAAPAFTTRSVGTKIVLNNALDGSHVDYAIGKGASTFWVSVPTTTETFTWYGGTALAATLTGAGLFTAVGAVVGTNITSGGNVTGNAATATALATGRTIGITGDATWTSPSFNGSGNVTAAITFATVNANVGSFGSATKSLSITANGKGLITAISEQTVTPAVGSITGLGTGVGTALAVNVGSAGAFLTFNGAGGTPSSLTLTNATGLPIAGLTASTSTAIGVGSIELGHASDTTITRVSAGVVAVEGSNVLLASGLGSITQAYDADLATIAGLAATTDNFIVSVASAWASRTPAQVRTTLGLVIGTNVQAWNADLDGLLTAWSVTTPTPTSGAGTLTSASSSIRAKKVGKTVFFSARITITTNGTGASWVQVALPYSSVSSGDPQVACGRNTTNGISLGASISNNSTALSIVKYDGTYPGADSTTLVVSGSYEAA